MSKDWQNKLETLIYQKAILSTGLATALGVTGPYDWADKFGLAWADNAGREFPFVTFRLDCSDYSEELNAAQAVTLYLDVWSQADSKKQSNDIERELALAFEDVVLKDTHIKTSGFVKEFRTEMREADTRIFHTAIRYAGTAIEL